MMSEIGLWLEGCLPVVEGAPRFVVLDLRLPDCSGVATVKGVRETVERVTEEWGVGRWRVEEFVADNVILFQSIWGYWRQRLIDGFTSVV
jgi:hypothetical protein